MLILNINGPINSGKSTVSKLLVQMLPHAVFIEVDDLLSDAEEQKLGLTMQDGWAERLNRLDKIISDQKTQHRYETIIFAYPMTDNLYRRWSTHVDKNTRFIAITLAPSLEKCLTNRGTRKLTDWEMGRIKEMYSENYHKPTNANLIINNDGQTPHQTAQQVADFIAKQR
ncbi:MAG: adenylyl-sulfate kinase [Alphaproteobacteria bacterium]|nr:adenylyl-sulfate kinase [Alphaproteobacteria bacterium]